ncbi:MOSC domain-containing protein [Lentilitoribacter sp. Alg239-R112]|uniref:MOSC domain-containing protein n=1 Tax=Lentilitoribacter sp. Alg239-R112 TaxID=2305987 RepID=UPI0018D73E54|nr:MOSC domain-containing protein [Lentilitoribacter sp. Alg239-R112]
MNDKNPDRNMGKVMGRVIGLYIGQAEDRWEGKAPSAIGKKPTSGPLEMDFNGFLDDDQADKKVHGGLEKAIHHYASEHMEYWKREFPEKADMFTSGCFGENISSTGVTEENLHLGDILQIGDARVQICQGRQPCWKLNAHIDEPSMAPKFQKTRRTGWYYRIIKTGNISVGDDILLIERPYSDWPLSRLIKERFNPKMEPAHAAELATIEALSQSWRATFIKRSTDPNFKEDTSKRLNSPS